MTQAVKTGVVPTDDEVAEVTKLIGGAVTGTLAQSLADELVKSMPAMIEDRKALREGFEGRLNALWGVAFDLLEAMIECSMEFGIEFHRGERRAARAESDYVFEAVMRLHARACRIAREILTLMRAGYSMGAMSRVRALEENVIVSLFIREQGRDTAERYLLHQRATRYRAALEANQHADVLHELAASDAELLRLKGDRDTLVARFDQPCFDRDYGWALSAMCRGCSIAGHTGQHKVTFAEIEKKVNLDHYRPYYRIASQAIHADPRALYWDMGLDDSTQGILFYGPSNDGFADPASLAAHLVGLTTIGFVLVRNTTADRLMKAVAIMKLADPLNAALRAAERELAERKQQNPTPGGMFSPGRSGMHSKMRRRNSTTRTPPKILRPVTPDTIVRGPDG